MGEEALIATYFAPLAAGFPGACGLLDDCASVAPSLGHELVVTVDAVAAGVHFFPDDAAFDIAWKALAVNVSDLIAKGATPLCYFMALSFPELPEPRWLDGFVGGLKAAQERYGLALAGGDTDRRPGQMSIAITAVGEVPLGRMVRRYGARPGDLLFVTGDLGASALGLRLRRDAGLAAKLKLEADETTVHLGRYLRPEPRLAVAPLVRRFAAAAMDISDGLVKDLGRLARASGVRGVVRAGLVPLSGALRRLAGDQRSLLELALTGGDDYGVLLAVAPHNVASLKSSAASDAVLLTQIGEIIAGEGVAILDDTGQPLHFSQAGYDHFA